MSEHCTPSIPTRDALLYLGFVVDSGVLSEEKLGLSFNFGNFKLNASHCHGRDFNQVVLLTADVFCRRSMRRIASEMPAAVESTDLAKAWVAWSVGKAKAEPEIRPQWLEEGCQLFHLLPWVRERIAYDARPHCSVNRKWLRLALNDLKERLTSLSDDSPVMFSYDGNILDIRCDGWIRSMQASGKAWPHPFEVDAGTLRNLPKRLMGHVVEVDVWKSKLGIGNRRYGEATPIS